MNERQSDFEWLQQFAREGNQNAFREIVRRHIDLVFATAMRKVGDVGGAQEISQNVFSALARKSWRFAPDDSLPAWLHKTTLLESQCWLRGELRRRRRQQTAAELGTTMKTPDEQPAFNALVPLLDEALLSLREKDRTALLLRFYENQSLRDVGASLGVSDDTAQKRVQTALEKLTEFFTRRGFKTASVTVATAALQHTASAASSATVTFVSNTALQTAPPAIAGITALLARFASLTKVQTAAVCVAIAAVPVGWQWHERSELRDQLASSQNNFTQGQAELASLQTDITKLTDTKTKRESELAEATTEAAKRAALTANLGDWRKQLRERLTAGDYQWPDDLSVVRIPKATVPEINIGRPITRPGTVASEARELMGLTPDERQQAEDVLQHHFAVMDKLAGEKFYQTNSASHGNLPPNVITKNVWVVPKLGEAAQQQVAEVKAGLENVLRGERWAMVSRGFDGMGMGTLDTALGLSAGNTRQEISAWLADNNGELSVSAYIAGSIGDNGAYWSSGSPAFPVRQFADIDFQSDEMRGYFWLSEESSIPKPIKDSIFVWVRKEAARLNEGGAK